MRKEVLDILKQDERVMDGLHFGKFEGDDFVVVEGWDVIERIDEILSKSGIEHEGAENELGEFGFSDEYTMCSCCYTYLKTTPDHYGWQPRYITIGTDYIDYMCLDCAKDYKAEYVEERINNTDSAIRLNFINENDLEELGFKRYNVHSFESGYHAGQNDEPKEVFKKLSSYYDEILFTIDETSQFYMKFSAWVRSA
jgi:hypothetical protein